MRRFREIDRQDTAAGELVLRCRQTPWSDEDVYEVKLGEEFLMSSMFTVAEEYMADLALRRHGRRGAEVVVAGLGLGHTALTALSGGTHTLPVESVLVIELLPEVISWHARGLVPLGPRLTADQRCTLRYGDFYSLLRDGTLDPSVAERRFDVMLVDIDHSPTHVLRAEHGWFYTGEGLRAAVRALRVGGVLALWSNEPPDAAFLERLDSTFACASAEVVSFHNPVQDRPATATVYLAVAP